MDNKPGEANFFPDVPVYPEMGTFQPVYGKFDLTTYIQGASDYEIMAFLVGKYNACLEAYENITKLSTDTITACKQLQDWINSWFTNLDVQEELNNKIDSMVADGSFGTLLHQTFDAQINQQTTNTVTQWLVANVTPTGSAVIVDKSLSIEGAAADAKATGELKEDLATLMNKSKNMFFVEQGEIVNGIITVNVEKTGSVINFKQNAPYASTVNALLMDISLEKDKKYTLSANRISGSYSSSGAINLGIYRRDNNSLAGLLNLASVLEGSSLHTTFTADFTSYYIQANFAPTSLNASYDCYINLSLVEGENADYLEYGVNDINKELPTIQYLIKNNIYDIIVAKDGTGDYITVTEAVKNAKDFASIYVKNGTYDNEIVKAWLKTVFIFGESRDGVIIKNNTGAYATPPIEMGTGMLKNLTVYAEGNATPTNKGYALHSESSVEASSCNFFILENCTFKSDYRQSWGMGMRGDTHYYARNCTFEEVYFHDCEHEYRATKQYIEFDSCNIIAKANGTALLLQDQQMSSANVNLMFNRCLIKSENGANIQYGKWTGSDVEWVSSLDDFPTWHLSTYSFGNSDNALNA